MDDIKIEFSEALLEETTQTYKWSKGNVRIKGDVMEVTAHKAEERCGRKSLWKSGSHKSGFDMNIMEEPNSLKAIRVKSKKKKTFRLSSYRLTTCKTTEEINKEIQKRDESFEKYLICLTYETSKKHIVKWGSLIKSKINFKNIEWIEKFGRKGTFSGYKSKDNKFFIHKSMSNQLWFEVNEDDLEIICTFEYELNK
jgi:hypothetical protein